MWITSVHQKEEKVTLVSSPRRPFRTIILFPSFTGFSLLFFKPDFLSSRAIVISHFKFSYIRSEPRIRRTQGLSHSRFHLVQRHCKLGELIELKSTLRLLLHDFSPCDIISTRYTHFGTVRRSRTSFPQRYWSRNLIYSWGILTFGSWRLVHCVLNTQDMNIKNELKILQGWFVDNYLMRRLESSNFETM